MVALGINGHVSNRAPCSYSLEISTSPGATHAPKEKQQMNPKPKIKTAKTIGYADIRALNPCYDPVRFYPKTWTGTWFEILKDERVPIQDRIWVGIRALPDDKTKRLFACWCAEQALSCIHPSKWDQRSLKAVEVARRFALGKADLQELLEARRAADAAAAATYAAADADAAAADAAAAAAAAANAAAAAAATYAAAAAAAATYAAYAYADAAAADANAAADAAYAAANARREMQERELKRLIRLHKECVK